MGKIYAIDFDGTLCQDAFPSIGKPNRHMIAYAKRLQTNGNKLILWTCRNGERLKEAIYWCAIFGLYFDAVNDNLPETLSKYGTNSRKITADYYIDDRMHGYLLLKMQLHLHDFLGGDVLCSRQLTSQSS